MKLNNLLCSSALAFLIILIYLPMTIFSQTLDDDYAENWFKPFDLFHQGRLYHRFDLYSKEDVINAKQTLSSLINNPAFDEWEGSFNRSGWLELNVVGFKLNSKIGFIQYDIYTCAPELRFLNYGKVFNTPEYIEIIPEYAGNSPRTNKPIRYIKVKWGKNHYLVEENAISAFAEKAVGIYVEPAENEGKEANMWWNYWVKGDEDELKGLPVFPDSYKQFLRYPIKTKVVAVGKRTIEVEKYDSGEICDICEKKSKTLVTIGASENKNVKKGMTFLLDSDDSLEITQVFSKTAIGIVERSLDDKNKDECYKDGEKTDCPKIQVGMNAETQVGNMFW